MNLKPRNRQPLRGRWLRGFSQLELVTTIALAGIMSASVVPKMIPQAAKSTATYQALQLADDLRHTRLLAMGWGKSLQFNTDAGSWRVRCVDAASCTQAMPAAATCPNPTPSIIDHGHRGAFCVALENGVTLSGPTSVQFDLLGRPQASGTISYTLSSNGTAIAVVSVAAGTGFVSTQVLQ